MASPSTGSSPWRRRAQSVSSQDRDSSTPTPTLLTSPRAKPQNIGDARLLSTSSSTVHREPIRSFISGSARDSPGEHLDVLYIPVLRSSHATPSAGHACIQIAVISSCATHKWSHSLTRSFGGSITIIISDPVLAKYGNHHLTNSQHSTHRQRTIREKRSGGHSRACFLFSF